MKVVVFALFSKQARPWVGAYQLNGEWIPMSWTHEGKFYTDDVTTNERPSAQDVPELALIYDRIKG